MKKMITLLALIYLSAALAGRGQSVDHVRGCGDLEQGFVNARRSLYNLYKNNGAEPAIQTENQNVIDSAREVLSYCGDRLTNREQAIMLEAIGFGLINLKQSQDAIAVLQRCVTIEADYAGCWLDLGDASVALGRRFEAKAFWKKAIGVGAFDDANADAIEVAQKSLARLEKHEEDCNFLVGLKTGGALVRIGPDAFVPDSLCSARHLDFCGVGWGATLADSIKLTCNTSLYGDLLAVDPSAPESSRSAPGESSDVVTNQSFGTGFFVSNQGDILTNNHVVAGCRRIAGRDGSPLRLISRNVSSDLALVKTESGAGSVAVLRSGPAPQLGDAVVAFGFPLPGLLSSEGNVSTGVLSATSGLQNDIRFVQISAPVQPGNSGGPLFDSSGHVIGVVVGKLDALQVARETGDIPQNVNFAVHWSELRAFLDEQGIQYRKAPSQHNLSTPEIAATAAKIAVAIECSK
jgi:S1-C subfamily serine protease